MPIPESVSSRINGIPFKDGPMSFERKFWYVLWEGQMESGKTVTMPTGIIQVSTTGMQ